jgi:glycoside/pentoside/hexuronide:cation symporter, GPH family
MTPLSARLRITWAVGSLGTALAFSAVNNLYLFHAVKTLGLDPIVAATLSSTITLMSALWDPYIGRLADRERLSGVPNAYLLGGAVLTGASPVLLFTLPAFVSPVSAYPVMAIGLLAYTIGLSLFGAPYVAMAAMLADHPHERTRLMAYRGVCLQIGASLGGTACPALVSLFGGTPAGFWPMGLITAVTVTGVLLTTWRGMPARASVTAFPREPSIAQQLRHLRKHTALLTWIPVTFARFASTAARSSVFLFFLTQVMDRSTSDLAAATFATILSMVACTPLWLKLGERLTKFRALQLAFGLYAVVVLSWMFADAHEADVAFLARCACIGLCAAGIFMYSSSIMADTLRFVPEGEAGSHPATYAATYGSAEKLGVAFGTFIGGALVSASSAPGAMRPSLLAGVTVIPVAMCIIAILAAQLLQRRSLAEAQSMALVERG